MSNFQLESFQTQQIQLCKKNNNILFNNISTLHFDLKTTMVKRITKSSIFVQLCSNIVKTVPHMRALALCSLVKNGRNSVNDVCSDHPYSPRILKLTTFSTIWSN